MVEKSIKSTLEHRQAKSEDDVKRELMTLLARKFVLKRLEATNNSEILEAITSIETLFTVTNQ
jgi:hypothetical protein